MCRNLNNTKCCTMWRSFVVRLGVFLLLSLLIAFMLLHHTLFDYSPLLLSLNNPNNSSSPLQIQHDQETTSPSPSCDLFVGDWVADEAEPPYNSSCRFIIDHQNCGKNGRPDSGFLRWRWRPGSCDLARFDPLRFLELMRNKRWAFVGDSLSRNHVQSLLCMLSKVEEGIQVYHDDSYQSLKWLFPSFNFTASVIWSPFLAKSIIPENIYTPSPSEIDLYLDILDPIWTQQYKELDYIIFSSGKWYSRSAIYYENNTIVGCHYCPKRNLTELGFDWAYRRVIKNVIDYIVRSNHSGSIFYRTTSPDHFEGAEWYEGGNCSRKEPAKEGEMELNYVDRVLRDVEVEEFAEAEVRAWEEGVKLRVLDVNPMSLLRPDGHPGPYRFAQPFSKGKNGKVISDCLHWCLPGPIDSWNDVLMEMIVNG